MKKLVWRERRLCVCVLDGAVEKEGKGGGERES